MAANGNERWIPRCPKCSESQILLAPANQHSKGSTDRTEVYCPNCQWQARIGEVLWVRV